MDPNNPEHVKRLHDAPEFWDSLEKLKGPFDELGKGKLAPLIDKRGDFQISSSDGEGMTQEYMDRVKKYGELIESLLQMKEDPITHEMLRQATIRYEKGEL